MNIFVLNLKLLWVGYFIILLNENIKKQRREIPFKNNNLLNIFLKKLKTLKL